MFATISSNSHGRTLGFSKDISYKISEIKEAQLRKKLRFRKHFEPICALNEKEIDNEALLANRQKSEANIELQSIQKPGWALIFSQTKDLLIKTRKIHEELQKLMGERIQSHFKDTTVLDRNIHKQTKEASELLRQCETNIKSISSQSIDSESLSELKVRKNIEKSLALEIQELALALQKQEKSYVLKLRSYNSGELFPGQGAQSLDDDSEEQEQALDDMEKVARERDSEINSLIENINQLGQMFSHMNRLVIEQGTMIDRIDYNLEVAEGYTKKGTGQLQQTKTRLEKGCTESVIKGLYGLIIVFTILLALKYMHRG